VDEGTSRTSSTHAQAFSPSKVRLLNKIIHKNLLQQRIRLILHDLSVPLPLSRSATYLQPIMSLILIKRLPCFITLRPWSVRHTLFDLGLHTLNTTMNPVSHSLSLFTFVKSSGVFSGRPPLGGITSSSGCCAYKSRKALVRPPFCSAVTLG
jgi:hypothetical protein